ncbi:MAG: MBL fold metallo-hydrolase [Actinomycetaceae bacterium]|nr:MBL fold metallo-hydrolase [Actinomycetaceae bacterium]
MLLQRIYDEDLAQASYFIGCQAKNEALVIDPRRDIQPYLDLAAENGMKITHVTETHIHADYLSGTRELAAATGATIHLSGEGGEDWQYGFEGEIMHDGDTVQIGNLTLQAVHTPGHTPEHMSFLLTDGAFSDKPGYMFTGDFVFAGDLGRPDLLDAAAGGIDTRFAGAKQTFESLRDKFATLPDYIQVYPAHGSGSACGKALGAVPVTTVGYERNFSWWGKYIEENDEQGFVDALLDGQPDAHGYFERMKRQNREGPAIMGERKPLQEMVAEDVAGKLDAGTHVFVDTRHQDEVHKGTVKGALNINESKPATYGGWSFNPERDDAKLVLLAPSQAEAQRIWDHLVRVGIDNVDGYVTSLQGLPVFVPEVVTSGQLEGVKYDALLDLREHSEFVASRVPGAKRLGVSRVMWELDQLNKDDVIVTYCQSGRRSSVGASALRRAGYNVVELKGSHDAWVSAGMPTESGE